MPKLSRPDYYKAPLRSRADIIDFLMEHKGYHGGYNGPGSPLAWNVKCYNLDFDADHLIEVYRQSEYYDGEGWLDYPEWREPALAEYKEIKNYLWEWAVESARMTVEDSDGFTSLWNGTGINVRYAFSGRSGGWLIITTYNKINLTKLDKEDFRWWLHDMPYRDLHNLYQLVVQNDHDFRREAVKSELEFQAAWAWIENCCSSIPKPDRTQAKLPLQLEEA